MTRPTRGPDATARPSGLPQAAGRVGVIAGSGSLPVEVVSRLVADGRKPFLVLVAGEAEPHPAFADCESVVLGVEQSGSLVSHLRRAGVTHAVLAGGVARRPALLALLRNAAGLVRLLPRLIAGLVKGDDGLLRALVGHIEAGGIKVVGAHEIVPDLLAPAGTLTRAKPHASDCRDIDAALAAARAIGALDIGQAAIAVGGRVIALEGIEGTDGLLERARALRGHGRIAGKTRGVLVKCAKPGQELRADLPAIGPRTVEDAHAAGLAGVAVEAGRSFILSSHDTIARADALGLFVVGLDLSERQS